MANNCPKGTNSYTWRRGDSFASVAARYGVQEGDLREINGNYRGNPDVGDTICVPSTRCPNGSLYIVHKGDTMTSIARAFDIPLKTLTDANPFVDPDLIYIGQVLCVPAASAPVEPEPSDDCVCIENLARYQVLQGESYVDLLMKTCMPYALFKFLNPQLTPGSLRAGQTYFAPKESFCGMVEPRSAMYQLQPGEDLAAAAKALNVSAGTLLSRNPNLAPGDFVEGMIIRV